ncbi:hypothetical protein NW754_005416 [Fusarium falciforme]|nr:hypothetical protein NW754_005416 [Fusarium falciforme]
MSTRYPSSARCPIHCHAQDDGCSLAAPLLPPQPETLQDIPPHALTRKVQLPPVIELSLPGFLLRDPCKLDVLVVANLDGVVALNVDPDHQFPPHHLFNAEYHKVPNHLQFSLEHINRQLPSLISRHKSNGSLDKFSPQPRLLPQLPHGGSHDVDVLVIHTPAGDLPLQGPRVMGRAAEDEDPGPRRW